MVVLRRRTLLAGVATSLALAGCQDRAGHNPMLRLRNPSPAPAEVRIGIRRQYNADGQEEEVVYEDVVSIAGSATRDLEVFTASGQYRVRVERGDHHVEFLTAPFCDSASTAVTLRSGGQIEYHVEFCEGPPRSGISTPS